MALGDGNTWDESTPTDATVAINIDDYNRDLRKGVRSRMALEHEWPASQSATSEAGKHKFITIQEQSTKPTLAGTQVSAIYCKTVGTSGQGLYFEEDDGTEIQITDASGKVKRSAWTHDGTQVFSGTTPTSYTDLDLSSYVGSNHALVLLYVVAGANGANTWWRTNGDTAVGAAASDQDAGTIGVRCHANQAGCVMLETDSGGIVEWKANAAVAGFTVTLKGYIK